MTEDTKDLEYWLLTNDEAIAKHREEKREILKKCYGSAWAVMSNERTGGAETQDPK